MAVLTVDVPMQELALLLYKLYFVLNFNLERYIFNSADNDILTTE